MSIYTECYEKALVGLPPIYAFLVQDAVEIFEQNNVLPTSSPPPKGGWRKLFKDAKSEGRVLPEFDTKAPKQCEDRARTIIQILPGGVELLENEDCSFSGMGLGYIGLSRYGIVIGRALGTIQSLAKRYPEYECDTIACFTASIDDLHFIPALKSVCDALTLRGGGKSSDENEDANNIRDRAIIKGAIKSGSKKDAAIVKSFLAPLTPENKKAWENAKASERKRKSRKKKTQKIIIPERRSNPSNLLTYWLPLVLWQKGTSLIAFTIEDSSPKENLDLTDRAIRYEKAIDKAIFDLKLYRDIRE